MSATNAQLAQLQLMKLIAPYNRADVSPDRLNAKMQEERDAYVADLSHSD